jgi:hypothetical protein
LLSRAKIIIVCQMLLLTAAPLASGASLDSYDDWYQIELIIFKQNKLLDSNEIWPLDSLSYPHNIVKISTLEELKPQTLKQLEDLLAYKSLVFEEDSSMPGSTQSQPADNFVFKSRSRKASTPTNVALETNENIDVEILESIDQTLLENDGFQNGFQESIEDLMVNQKRLAFESLDKSEHQLTSIARSINRSSLYKMLLHQAWLQPVSSIETIRPILIQTGDHFGDSYEIDGTIKISRSRFLHLDTDLWFTEFASRYQQTSTPLTLNLSPETAKKYANVVNWESNRGRYIPVHAHRLIHSRRMRRSTLHYIDHPRFGILIQIEKFTQALDQ